VRSVQDTLSLTIGPCPVQFAASLEDFQNCASVLEDKPNDIRDRNFPGLLQLVLLYSALWPVETDLPRPAASSRDASACRGLGSSAPLVQLELFIVRQFSLFQDFRAAR
jgi:hypothetical protein